MENNQTFNPQRRGFMSTIAAGAATLGLSAIAPLTAKADYYPADGDPDAWFNKINGKHRVVFDATRPHEAMPFAWPLVFLLTNEATGTPVDQSSVVVVLRHDAIPYAMQDELWAKYKFGELFKAPDPVKNLPAATRNPFWKPQPGDFKVPGLGEVPIGINQLQEKGVMFCVCDMAMTVYSGAIAGQTNGDAAAIKKEFIAGLLPGIQVVPSGVWAVGRAQEHGCAYIFAG